ncbi:acyltransferase family protein [Bradyrhizobium sp. SSUT77]|uniref:acyltransferase family protein n=1 Tax=Bradyrhizobium sp. SSUT77 TaxID=3040603 RepID=UPI002447C90D|nr:acyltransferase family protein [Bradyrhizobium sp. SSUT77]MDH2342051.1 acyltransferase family protein [Bradyrhizobium sp. SSUT77]
MPSKLPYRPEIDGLRAIAVLPVILFHAGIPGFSGGFVGVDVFFVISGYLITSIILDEYENGGFSFVGFYERRARRILPPLFFVCIACLPVAVWCLGPRDLADFSKSLLSVCAFVSNFFFWAQSGYFDTQSELKPLLHTWSLAVEEQFYLLFPILLFWLLRLGRTRATACFVVIAAASFAYAQWGSHHAEAAAFYLLPARFWELLLGALLPLSGIAVQSRVARSYADALALLGLAMIALPVFGYRNVPYPGVYALAPTLGTALAILFLRRDTVLGHVIGSRVPVAIGLVSYSAYLWHQPLFAFARLTKFYETNIPVFAGLSVLSMVLAYLTYLLVERPARDRKRIGRRAVFASCGVAIAIFASLGSVGVFTNGLENIHFNRYDMATRRAYELIRRYALRDLKGSLIDNGDCLFWSSSPDSKFEVRFKACAAKYGPAVMVVGDSHGMNVYNGLAKAKPGPFVVGLVNEGCRAWNDSELCPYAGLKGFLERNGSSLRGIVFNVSGAHLLTDPAGNAENHHLFEWETGYLINYEKVGFTLSYLRALAPLAKIVWLGPFVEARVNFRDLPQLASDGFLMNPVALHHFKELDEEIAKEVADGPRTIQYLSFYDVLKVDQYLLFTDDCLTFSDPDHLSACGEALLGNKLKVHLPWLNS